MVNVADGLVVAESRIHYSNDYLFDLWMINAERRFAAFL
jgi:hypothetical protein